MWPFHFLTARRRPAQNRFLRVVNVELKVDAALIEEFWNSGSGSPSTTGEREGEPI
jgi:hypothetical protein